MKSDIDAETDLVEIACLHCGTKIYIDPASRSFHNFCGTRCENAWREMFGELVDSISCTSQNVFSNFA